MMNKKTDKQKCLEMWQWLAKHPELGKDDYRNHLYSLNLGYEYAPCWACRHCEYNCYECPIVWDHEQCSNVAMCSDTNSAYFHWYSITAQTKSALLLRKFYAKEMVRLIEETWTETWEEEE